MIISNTFKVIIVLLLVNTISIAQAQSQHAPQIFNAAIKEDLAAYKSLNLDDTHPNLLDPAIAKSDHQKVIASWTDLHKSIGEFLGQQNFSWDNEGKSVSIWQKIYFNPNGKVTHYFYHISNPEISAEKKKEFGKLVSDYVSGFGIAITRPEQFAQCGKTKY